MLVISLKCSCSLQVHDNGGLVFIMGDQCDIPHDKRDPAANSIIEKVGMTTNKEEMADAMMSCDEHLVSAAFH